MTRSPCRWRLPQTGEKQARHLAQALGLQLPASRVLVSRGLQDEEQAKRFLDPSIEHLHDPFLLDGMDTACERLLAAIRDREPILLYGDYDADGTTAIVILKKALDLAGAICSFHVPHRLIDGYGMRTEVVAEAAERGVRLIVSVDTGIRAAEVVTEASALGIDCIITDHHLPSEELPPALAVLNPSLPGSSYPENNLCGAGVAFKLAQALFSRLGWDETRQRKLLLSFMKLVAIATVADVVPLSGENRVVVRHGLEGLRDVRNPGLSALLEVAGFVNGEAPTAAGVSFRIAPRINAAGRMAHAIEVINLFLSDDEATARAIASRLDAWNTERRDTEAAIVQQILDECAEVPLTEDNAALVFAGRGWHRGVVGIVATRLVEQFHRPVIVLSVDEETGEAQGSGRSTESFHILNALEAMAPLLTRFGGHERAAGLALKLDQVEEFRKRFRELAAAQLGKEDFIPSLSIDARVKLRELNQRAVSEVFQLAPFGFGNTTPVFCAEDVRLAGEPFVMKEKHLRLQVEQDGVRQTMKAWNFAPRLDEFRAGSLADIAFSIEEDTWAATQGLPGWCLSLRDLKPSGG